MTYSERELAFRSLKINRCDDVMYVVLLLLLMSSVSVFLCSVADHVLHVAEFLKMPLPFSTKTQNPSVIMCLDNVFGEMLNLTQLSV